VGWNRAKGGRMGRYVAFLRGINVGGNATIPMAELRTVLAGCGYTEVSTLLNSGNAIFTAPGDRPAEIETEMAAAIEARFGRAVRCLVRTGAELARVLAADPYAGVATDGARYVVAFLAGEPDPARLAAIDPDGYLPDRFAAAGREIYIWCPNGLADTKFTHAFFERRLGVAATVRNWNTVRKAASACGP
jgi:uncharacterized protein (DUF1697 family)